MTQKTYSGKGMKSMIDISYKHRLNRYNSDLHVKDPTDPNSQWTIIVK